MVRSGTPSSPRTVPPLILQILSTQPHSSRIAHSLTLIKDLFSDSSRPPVLSIHFPLGHQLAPVFTSFLIPLRPQGPLMTFLSIRSTPLFPCPSAVHPNKAPSPGEIHLTGFSIHIPWAAKHYWKNKNNRRHSPTG